ncbi:MAG: response regulator [Bacteroidota bacterium]|nr:response regulator [Bacteroidota bacterium]
MIKVAILDDEIIICETLEKFLSELGYNVVGYALSYQEAIELAENEKPDVFLLDINLNEKKSGKDFAAYLREHVAIPLIFISSYSDKTTLDSIKQVRPNGYLVKPFNKNDLYTSIEIALNNFNIRQSEEKKEMSTETDSFFIKQDSFFEKIKYDDLLYIKSEGVYVELYTETKKYLHRETLKNMLDRFLPKQFQQTQRSYIVNTNHISAASRESVMIKGTSVPVSPSYANELFLKLNIG